ncbi:hypothetical protein TSMEX_006318 [Taenia solium]|eukprot:TsM_000514200 transcript=TsM_000514200 gene=TsM_000514200
MQLSMHINHPSYTASTTKMTTWCSTCYLLSTKR